MKKKLLVIATIVAMIILNFGLQRDQKTAIIIDPINNESEFKTQAIQLLTENGYKTTYIASGNVTVNLMKNLPPDYDLYIFRVHSTCINNRTWIFTGETYNSQKYPLMQLADLVHKAKPSLESSYCFAVSPELITQYNEGFNDGLVLMMGCEGLSSNDMASAFCDEGASNYVSWTGNVCLEHTDQAFLAFLETYCTGKTTLTDTITNISVTVGADPVYHSVLRAYKTGP